MLPFLLSLVLLVAVMAVARLLRRRTSSRRYAGTGLTEWRAASAQLSRRDRWALQWATSVVAQRPPGSPGSPCNAARR